MAGSEPIQVPFPLGGAVVDVIRADAVAVSEDRHQYADANDAQGHKIENPHLASHGTCFCGDSAERNGDISLILVGGPASPSQSRYRGFNPARSHAGQSAAHAQPAACSTPDRPVLTLLIEAFALGKSISTTSSSLLLASDNASQGEFEVFYNSVKYLFVPVLNTATDTLAPPTLRIVSPK